MNSMKRLLCSELLKPHPQACLPQAQALGTSTAPGSPGESGRSSQKETKVGAEEWEGAELEEGADREAGKKTNETPLMRTFSVGGMSGLCRLRLNSRNCPLV